MTHGDKQKNVLTNVPKRTGRSLLIGRRLLRHELERHQRFCLFQKLAPAVKKLFRGASFSFFVVLLVLIIVLGFASFLLASAVCMSMLRNSVGRRMRLIVAIITAKPDKCLFINRSINKHTK